MRPSRHSLITEPTLKLPSINSTVKLDQLQTKKLDRKDRFYIRPQMKKILYSPFDFDQSKKAQKKQMMIQSCLLNKGYRQIEQKAFQQKVKSYLTDNRSMNQDEKYIGFLKNKVLIGKQAPFEYYKEYKKLGKLIQKAHCNKQNHKQSPYLAMLQSTQKMDILPLTMGIVKFQGASSILNLSNYNLGDNYITAMSSGLKKAKLIQKCYLSSNRITNKGFSELVLSLNQEVNTLDVSFNDITDLDGNFMEWIAHPQSRLQKLNLQKNRIKKKQTIFKLVQNVSTSKHLKILNLRGNGIGNDCADSLSGLIGMETQLQEFYLGRNFVTAKAGEKLFQLMAKNKNIKVFDYSLNNLGEDDGNLCAKAIANCLTKNKSLHHVDLSLNNFREQGSKIIAQGLQPNKKIYGFHFDGNHGYVDSRGFLIMEQKQLTSLHSLVQTKIDSYQICFKRRNISTSPKIFKNVCWICQGWHQQQFRFNVPQDYKQEKKLVYIHFDFELFSPRLINLQDKHVRYITMVPPLKYQYFFTFQNQHHYDTHTKPITLQFPQTFTYQMDHKPTTFTVYEVSQNSKRKSLKLVNDRNQIIIDTPPRTNGLVSKKLKVKWTYQQSVWAKYWKLENQDLLKKCFQRDWKCSKVMNLVKNQQDQDKVKDSLQQNYKAIKLLYRYFSSWSPFGDVWAVSNNAWTEFCQQAKIINKDTPLKITDLTFITTNSISGTDWKGNSLVPERGLVRFQFMQCLVRLAEQKYKKLGLAQNFDDSIRMIIKEHVLPLAGSLSFERWRQTQYFTQSNDLLLKKYRQIFTYIYKKNSKLNVKPGQKPFMCLNEFRSIIQRANLPNNSILERDIYVSFNFSMMTQVDELQNQRFIKMGEIQFIEALARCAGILPKSCIFGTQQQEDQVHFRFQWLINQLKNTQTNEDIKSQFNQQGSIFCQNQDDD